jgi:hypothetical protein
LAAESSKKAVIPPNEMNSLAAGKNLPGEALETINLTKAHQVSLLM